MKNFVVVCLLLIAQQCIGQQTCQPPLNLLNPSAPTGGFGICLFNSTNNLATSLVVLGANNAWAIQNALVVTGGCYCREDCTPSQIVSLVTNALNTLGLEFSIENGIAELVYFGEQWNLYCYCPKLAGSTPRAAPPTNSFCGNP